jgi:HK97 family phage major capsid protein
MLTTEEKLSITEGFKAAGERIDSVEDDVKDSIGELKVCVDDLRKSLRSISQGFLTGYKETGEEYQRFWPTEDMAKQFGELFIRAAHQKAMGESTNISGGILVPEDLRPFLIQKLGQYGKFRKYATVLPMASDKSTVPKVDVDLAVYNPEENTSLTSSDMSFSQVGLTAHKLACLTKVSSELEEDSLIAIGEILGLSMMRSIAKKEDLIGFIGDGTSTYFGMTGIVGALLGVDPTIGNIKGLKVASGNAYSEIVLADFEGIVSILPSDADENARWYMNKKFFYQVPYALARAAGVANLFEVLSDRKAKYLMGYPVEFVSAMPSVEANSQICAILGDLQLGAYLGERRQLEIARSEQAYFVSDQIGFRGIERIDINAFGVGDTSEAGPIVALITAAS